MKIGDRVEIVRSDYPLPPEGLQGVVTELLPDRPGKALAQAHVRLDRYITRDWWLYQDDIRVLDPVDALAALGRTSAEEDAHGDRLRPRRGRSARR